MICDLLLMNSSSRIYTVWILHHFANLDVFAVHEMRRFLNISFCGQGLKNALKVKRELSRLALGDGNGGWALASYEVLYGHW